MKIKKIIALYCLVVPYYAFPDLTLDSHAFDDFPTENPYSQEIVQLVNQTRAVNCGLTPLEILNVLTSPEVNFPAILVNQIYKHTNPPVIRPLHDLPSLRPWYGAEDELTFYATFFYDQMFHANFTRKGTYITDYLNVSEEDALMQSLEQGLSNFFDDPVLPQILPLFNIMRLQQRRLGVMLGLSKTFENLRINAAIPLYYSEFNFYLTQQQLDALNAAPFFGGDAPQPDSENPQNQGFSIFDVNTFAENYFISDQVGFGDIRFYVDYMMFQESSCPVRFGGQLTFPNSTIIKRSIAGSTFDKCYPGPGLDMETIICLLSDSSSDLTDKNAFAAFTQSYALQFLDRLSATVLQNSLSQRQASYGFLTEFFIKLTDCTSLNLFFEWDQFVKGNEDRPVIQISSLGQLTARDYSDESTAQDNLTFLQNRFNNIMFPPWVNLTLKQGDIIKARIYSQTNWRAFQWNIGYDLWYQDKEQILSCCRGPNTLIQGDVQAATRPAALQGKIFGGMNVQRHADYYEEWGWRAGLKGEFTVNNFGIGKDWVLAIDFVADFS